MAKYPRAWTCLSRLQKLMPGEHAVVRIQYEHTNPEREVIWAGRGDKWVTKIECQASAIKDVNVSKHGVWIDMRTPLARIVQYGSFPQAGRFVRPGTRAYCEWQTLIMEHAQSEQDRLRAERREHDLREREPPCVPKINYQCPTRIMLTPQPGSAEVKMAQLQDPPPRFKVLNRGELVNGGTQKEEAFLVTTIMNVTTQVSESQIDSYEDDPGEGDTLDRDCTFADMPPKLTIEFEEPQGGETLAEVHPEQDAPGFLPEPASCTPLEKLEMEYERCMRVSAEGLDLEPGNPLNFIWVGSASGPIDVEIYMKQLEFFDDETGVQIASEPVWFEAGASDVVPTLDKYWKQCSFKISKMDGEIYYRWVDGIVITASTETTKLKLTELVNSFQVKGLGIVVRSKHMPRLQTKGNLPVPSNPDREGMCE
ncbi:LOW QUALITY PROTEIN: Aspartic protease [Phytophthora megakarya]|uniref:Aspartic protease n=1 Tax=Phytophthora megakarya TaxID=4795 RepID=A0A225WD69_9STRA|nr:LOW QUALITY PROTEIN: Aspartic protease [Phytophthora megakarya]